MIKIRILDTGADRYTLESDTKFLGRKYDNKAEYIEIEKPEAELRSGCIMFVTNMSGVVVEAFAVRNNPIAITSNLSQYPAVKIGFSFTRLDDSIKNSEAKQFFFLSATKPIDFAPATPEEEYSFQTLYNKAFVDSLLDGTELQFFNSFSQKVASIDLSEFSGNGGSSSDEGKIRSISLNGKYLPIDEKKNVDIPAVEANEEVTEFDQVYKKTANGVSGMLDVTTKVVEYTIAIRGNDGRLAFGDGIYDDDGATVRQLNERIAETEKGAANGVAELDVKGKVLVEQLPFGETENTIYDGAKGKALSNNVSELDEKVKTLNSNVADLNSSFDSLDFAVDGLNARVLNLDEKLDTKIDENQKGAAGGVASLGADGKVPSVQLPSYVDDVVDVFVVGSEPYEENWLSLERGGTPLTPEASKIYVVVDNSEYANRTYRWSGSRYGELSSGVIIGDVEGTAYDGGRGKSLEQTVNKIDEDLEVLNSALANFDDTVKDLNSAVEANTEDISDINDRLIAATKNNEGLMSSNDFAKLSEIESGAQKNTVEKVIVDGTSYSPNTQKEISITLNLNNKLAGKINNSEKGAADGVATLDKDGKIPGEQLPDNIGLEIGETEGAAFAGDRGVALEKNQENFLNKNDLPQSTITVNNLYSNNVVSGSTVIAKSKLSGNTDNPTYYYADLILRTEYDASIALPSKSGMLALKEDIDEAAATVMKGVLSDLKDSAFEVGVVFLYRSNSSGIVSSPTIFYQDLIQFTFDDAPFHVYYPTHGGTLALTSDIPKYYKHDVRIIDAPGYIRLGGASIRVSIISKQATEFTTIDDTFLNALGSNFIATYDGGDILTPRGAVFGTWNVGYFSIYGAVRDGNSGEASGIYKELSYEEITIYSDDVTEIT